MAMTWLLLDTFKKTDLFDKCTHPILLHYSGTMWCEPTQRQYQVSANVYMWCWLCRRFVVEQCDQSLGWNMSTYVDVDRQMSWLFSLWITEIPLPLLLSLSVSTISPFFRLAVPCARLQGLSTGPSPYGTYRTCTCNYGYQGTPSWNAVAGAWSDSCTGTVTGLVWT